MSGQHAPGSRPEQPSSDAASDAAPVRFAEYAAFYDLFYRDKDYPGESAFVARLLERFVPPPPAGTHILDLACGTGRHAQELSRMGYRVEGSDLSADMVAIAAGTAHSLGLPIRFHNESFQTADRIGGTFDAVLAMFSAIDYLTDDGELNRSLANIRGLLNPGGAFIFDFWNGDAVVRDFSPTRVKTVEAGDASVIRTSKTTVDPVSRIATINFHFELRRGGRTTREFSEVHSVRYFFPQEMTDFLAANGFEVVHRCPFLREDGALSPDDWNLTYVARPVR